jgi:hypothetical protein
MFQNLINKVNQSAGNTKKTFVVCCHAPTITGEPANIKMTAGMTGGGGKVFDEAGGMEQQLTVIFYPEYPMSALCRMASPGGFILDIRGKITIFIL